MPESAHILLRALGAEDGDRNRPAPRDVVAVDAGRRVVTQPDGFGALDKAALGAQFHQRESATALAEEIRSTAFSSERSARLSSNSHQATRPKIIATAKSGHAGNTG